MRPDLDAQPSTGAATAWETGGGPLVAIGGSEDKTGPCHVLAHVLALSRPGALVAVVAAGSSIPDVRLARYREVFARLGAGAVLDASPRPVQDGGLAGQAIAAADVVFITGGAQTRLMQAVHDTNVAAAIAGARRRGAVVAGTSAGASALSQTMLTGRGCETEPGLGLAQALVIDQHFTQRARMPRLLAALRRAAGAGSVGGLGVGIDEDTSLSVGGDGRLQIIGAGLVTFVSADGQVCAGDADAWASMRLPGWLDRAWRARSWQGPHAQPAAAHAGDGQR